MPKLQGTETGIDSEEEEEGSPSALGCLMLDMRLYIYSTRRLSASRRIELSHFHRPSYAYRSHAYYFTERGKQEATGYDVVVIDCMTELLLTFLMVFVACSPAPSDLF